MERQEPMTDLLMLLLALVSFVLCMLVVWAFDRL
jgi:hypothetical protein